MSAKVPPLQFRREDIPDLSTGERTDRLLKGLNQFGGAAETLLNGGLTFSANFRAFAREVTIRGGAAAVPAAAPDLEWHSLSLGAGFANTGTPYPVTRYRRDGSGTVFLEVAVDHSSGSVIGTLPAGYRPSAQLPFVGICGSGTAQIDVKSSGDVELTGPGSGNPKRFAFSFPAEDYSAPSGTDAVSQEWPIKVKNDLGSAPSHVLLTRLVSLGANNKETPVTSGGLAWSADKDQVLIHSIANVSPGARYRCTILVVAE